MKQTGRALRATLALLLALGSAACGGKGVDSSGSSEESMAAYGEAFKASGLVSTFADEGVYDGTVKDEDDATEAVRSLVDKLGGDETTELEMTAVTPTETGTTYYTFNQEAGDALVYGASVKLVTEEDGSVKGLIGSVLPDVKVESASEWGITQEEAEEEVRDELEFEGVEGVDILSEHTDRVIIPLGDSGNFYRLAWAVYTPNYNANVDAGYMAHYVSEEGSYLYAIPISEPEDADSQKGTTVSFPFESYTQEERTYEVPPHDGSTKELTLPVLVDPQTGEVEYLGDATRKILCADFAQMGEDRTIASPKEEDGTFSSYDLLVYDSFIRVWDAYDQIGWPGPDGQSSASLLVMGYVNDAGKPQDNAAYIGQADGWQRFIFGRVKPLGECLDVIAHEYTHCVTATTMTTNIYLNEYGAINEGMSDVMGNLVEMLLEGDEGAWIIGENSGKDAWRSMSDPHLYYQPAYRWDTYYVPLVVEGTEINDMGGVHTNSSLLNIISYKLDQAGMSPEDQYYYWMNVALALTPATDFELLAELLPWCMEESGYSDYVDAVRQATEEVGYTDLEEPTELQAGCGVIRVDYPKPEDAEQGHVLFTFMAEDDSVKADAWPAIGQTYAVSMLPAGDYYAYMREGEDALNYTKRVWVDDAWVAVESEDVDVKEVGTLIHVDEGEQVELTANGLEDAA